MKICVVTPTSGSETNNNAQTHVTPCLSEYLNQDVHLVEYRTISKENAIDDINELEIGNFDVFVNYLLTQEPFDKEWIEALKYLNTKYLVGIGSLPDSALNLLAESIDKPQTPFSASESNIDLPRLPLSKSNVQNYRDGDFSVLVVLMGQTACALTPLQYQGPAEDSWRLAPLSDVSDRLKQIAVSIFEKIRGTEYLGYLSTNFHVDKISGATTITNVNLSPRLFYAKDNSPWDSELIEKAFPGGHAAFFEALLSARLSRIPHYVMRNEGCARQHNRLARLYYTILDSTNVTHNRLTPFVGKYDYNGTVLDCCSGSGEFARFANEAGVKAKYSALDYSVEMTELPYSKKLYEQPFIIGPVQEVLTRAGMHDHVVCFGSLHLLQPFDFVSTISQMFLRARKSVTFDVDDLSDTYIKNFPDASSEKCWEKLEYNHNNVASAFLFGVPAGWRAVLHGERRYAYCSLVMKEDVYTHSFRFEREE